MTKKTPKKRKAKASGKRRTSDRVSRIAGKVLGLIRDGAVFEWYEPGEGQYLDGTHLVKALAASRLAQDEHRGRRK